MSKKALWSDHTELKKLTENWRSFLNEETKIGKVAKILANPSTNLDAYVAILKRYAGDPAFEKMATGGQEDGDPNDEKVKITRSAVPASSLTATQAEIGFDNSLADQMQNKHNGTETALGLKGDPITMGSKLGPSPLLVWNGKHILDGHHRWSQIMMMNPEGDVVIDNVTGPALDDEEEALKAMQMAIAIEADQVKTKPFEGANLMGASPNQVAEYVLKNITDDVLQLMVDAGKIEKPDKAAAAKYIAGNVPVIKKSKGKFSRERSMPQADFSGGKGTQDRVNALLGTGDVNFEDPKLADAGEPPEDELGGAYMKGTKSGFKDAKLGRNKK